MACSCGSRPAWLPREGQAAGLGERGFIVMRATGKGRTMFGQATGTRYPFGKRPRMYVDRRDAIYFLGPEVQLA